MLTLVEHYAGAFPLWLSPTQVVIIPIKDEHQNYALKVKENLQTKGIRVIIDSRNESLNKRIREGTVRKIPYLVILGDKEAGAETVAVRRRTEGDLGSMMIADFSALLLKEIDEKK